MVYFWPKITENEKTMPNMDAMEALMNAAFEESLSFLLSIIDNAAPAR